MTNYDSQYKPTEPRKIWRAKFVIFLCKLLGLPLEPVAPHPMERFNGMLEPGRSDDFELHLDNGDVCMLIFREPRGDVDIYLGEYVCIVGQRTYTDQIIVEKIDITDPV